VTLEVGVLAGAALFIFGLGGSVYAVLGWGRHGFGALDVGTTLRGVIPSVVAMVLGLQLALASFFLSVLGLKMRGLEPPADAEADRS
jgi:hypothetical protein